MKHATHREIVYLPETVCHSFFTPTQLEQNRCGLETVSERDNAGFGIHEEFGLVAMGAKLEGRSCRSRHS